MKLLSAFYRRFSSAVELYRCFLYICDCLYFCIFFNIKIYFKGLAFTLEERQALGIHGLLAAKFKSQEEQLDICRISVDRYEDNLNKYLYLVELQVTKQDKGTIDWWITACNCIGTELYMGCMWLVFLLSLDVLSEINSNARY